jgi:hypothetical protein
MQKRKLFFAPALASRQRQGGGGREGGREERRKGGRGEGGRGEKVRGEGVNVCGSPRISASCEVVRGVATMKCSIQQETQLRRKTSRVPQ